ncbi:chloroplastic group IIA intron splicing facilitator CRS1, chloroplastic [Asparagus officinalis]|nr:chloroplastic group IIA intron splicing facilitator CRS1, chloroplastic [Asparagus officinalis]
MKKIVHSIKNLRKAEPERELVQQVLEFREEGSVSVPWARVEERMVFRREKRERVATRAEMELPREELERLRVEARGLRKWVKAKKAGVTQEVVDGILKGWRKEELVMVKLVEPLCRNLDRAREIVEIKTGGLVVLSKKDALVVYRYQSNAKLFQKDIEFGPPKTTSMNWLLDNDVGSTNESLYVREANRLLDSLGPRFVDWWYKKPLPVDADLLPEVVPGFKPPFRLCPPEERPKLRDDELTYLRKIARPLPTHFALGKNTKLQGLAAAIIKLWEKCLIAKIAIKVGIPHTNNQQMGQELKRLTGGVLILRNKFYIILYRGKDFLPGKVASSVHEREIELHDQQLLEEEARAKAIAAFDSINESIQGTTKVGTFSEFKEIQANYLPLNSVTSSEKINIEAEKQNVVKQLKDEEHKLSILKLKIDKAEQELTKLNSLWSPSEQSVDRELLTVEERQSFQKIGLKMDEFLLLGRRGIYDGTIESIHQHWKHREVVKVITMQKALQQVNYTAKLLEIESGGLLVAVEKLRRGHAIIIYRGKNYSRMPKISPENLLTKRESYQRSIEIQRRGSMKYFARKKEQKILELKQRLRYLEGKAKELDSKEVQDEN